MHTASYKNLDHKWTALKVDNKQIIRAKNGFFSAVAGLVIAYETTNDIVVPSGQILSDSARRASILRE